MNTYDLQHRVQFWSLKLGKIQTHFDILDLFIWNGWRTTTAYRYYGILCCVYINTHVVRGFWKSSQKVLMFQDNTWWTWIVVCFFLGCLIDPFYRINHVHHWRLNFPTCDSSRRLPESLVEITQSQTNSQAEIWNKSKPIPSKYNIFIPTHMLDVVCFMGFHLEFVKSSNHHPSQ